MNTKLWIDDIRIPPDDTYDIARTYDDAIHCLSAFEYEDVYLDHDLADFSGPNGTERSGYSVVLWLVDAVMNNPNYKPPQRYHFLTANPVGRRNMQSLIERYITNRTHP